MNQVQLNPQISSWVTTIYTNISLPKLYPENITLIQPKRKKKKNNKSIWVISKCMKDIEKLSRISTCVRERPREMKSTSISLPPLKHWCVYISFLRRDGHVRYDCLEVASMARKQLGPTWADIQSALPLAFWIDETAKKPSLDLESWGQSHGILWLCEAERRHPPSITTVGSNLTFWTFLFCFLPSALVSYLSSICTLLLLHAREVSAPSTVDCPQHPLLAVMGNGCIW